MEPRELEIEEFNILNYLASDNGQTKSRIETTPFNITNEIIDSINSIVLTKKAITFVENDENACPKAVQLITRDENGYTITEEGNAYWDYYKWNILRQPC